ncbi:LemA family protein [Methylocystis sp. WRRC1]|uniref:LemA family protein n=1 Tax=Methylocystis sp. WRRC1 TaxID=1732014 RepID=UPI001D153EC7|nr:LemA family protein [Methylocystis sp. WRRC1]MCC3245193.1 LemA family protein [Methylocystis sp. WRRC1]
MAFLSWITLAGLAGAAGFALVAYRRLRALEALCDQAAADIDSQFRARHALLPDLFNAVRAFTQDERDTFDFVLKARAAALRATTPQAQILAETTLGEGVRRLLIIAESSPILQNSHEFDAFCRRIAHAESELAAARRRLNLAVKDYNLALRQFPTGLLAGRLHLARRSFYDVGVELSPVDEPVALRA